MKIIKSIDHKRLHSSFYEQLIYIYGYFNLFIEFFFFQYYTNILGTIRLSFYSYDFGVSHNKT